LVLSHGSQFLVDPQPGLRDDASDVPQISVTMLWDTVCHADGWWITRRDPNEKDIQWMQTTLADLKAKTERADQWH
jgi:hypothetical protein